MEVGKLIWMLVTTLGVATAVIVAGRVALWKVRQPERWMRGIAPLALGAGFVAGYALLLDFPRTWSDEPWRMGVVTAAIAGVLLAIAELLPAGGIKAAGRAAVVAALLAVATWLTVRRFTQFQTIYAAVLPAGVILHFIAARPGMREKRLWAVAPLVLMLCGFAASFVTLAWIDLNTQGRMMVMVTALSGLALTLGFVPWLRGAARGAVGFLTLMLAVMLVFVTRYRGDLPWWIFAWLGAGPLATAVAWLPALRRRPFLCTVAAAALALAIVVPAVLVAAKYAPSFDME